MSVLFVRGVSDDLKNRFKAKCASVGKSMTEVVVGLLEGFAGSGCYCDTCTGKIERPDHLAWVVDGLCPGCRQKSIPTLPVVEDSRR